MKKSILLFLMLGLVNLVYSQAPQGIPYQAVARDAQGNPMANQSLAVQFSLHEASADGAVVFQETQSTTTNGQGLFSLTFGSGVPSVGTFSSINWGSGYKFLQVQADFGNGYVDLGTQQLMSVPYALYAGSSANNGNSQNNSNYSPSSDSTLSAVDGSRLTNGVFQVPQGEKWLLESVNVNDGATSIPIPGSYSYCTTVSTIYNYHCFYNTTLSNLQYVLFSIPGITVKVDLPDTFNNYGGYGYGFDCNTCPQTATSNSTGFSNSNLASIRFPIWLNENETITVAQGVFVSYTKYK